MIQAISVCSRRSAVTKAVEITDNRSPLFEIARVPVRFDHVARFIGNANHGIVRDSLHIHTLIPPKKIRASALGHSGKR